MSVEEYLAWEETQSEKHEYYRGEILAMAGASRKHAWLTTRLASKFVSHLDRKNHKSCQVYSSDLRLYLNHQEHFFYPDVMVVCGEQSYRDENNAQDALLIAEVLSSSTEAYDRGIKFQHYQMLPSLQYYLLVSQETSMIECFTRQTEGWLLQTIVGEESTVRLPALEMEFTLKSLYGELFV